VELVCLCCYACTQDRFHYYLRSGNLVSTSSSTDALQCNPGPGDLEQLVDSHVCSVRCQDAYGAHDLSTRIFVQFSSSDVKSLLRCPAYSYYLRCTCSWCLLLPCLCFQHSMIILPPPPPPPVHCHPCMSAMTGIARYFLCVAPNNREGENECGRGPSEPGSDEPEPDLSPNGVARRCPNGQIGLVATPTTARTNLLL
jgi:hypothetical protein